MRKFTFLNHTFEIVMGPSAPNPGLRREYKAKGIPHLATCDAKMWVGIDDEKWYIIRDPIQFINYAELAETEDELFWLLEEYSDDFKYEKV